MKFAKFLTTPFLDIAQKMKFSIKDFCSKCDLRELRLGHIYWRNP